MHWIQALQYSEDLQPTSYLFSFSLVTSWNKSHNAKRLKRNPKPNEVINVTEPAKTTFYYFPKKPLGKIADDSKNKAGVPPKGS